MRKVQTALGAEEGSKVAEAAPQERRARYTEDHGFAHRERDVSPGGQRHFQPAMTSRRVVTLVTASYSLRMDVLLES